MNKHFLDLNNFSAHELERILNNSIELKKQEKPSRLLEGKYIGLIFEKSSTRTRVSFEVAMTQLGGKASFLSVNDLQLGRGEPVADTAKVLSSMLDCIVLRTLDHGTQIKFSENSSVPIINGLSDRSHPCQLLADLLTFYEERGSIQGKKVAWCGDFNNVCFSYAQAAELCDFELWINPENGDLDESQWLLIKTSMGSDSVEVRDTVAQSNQSIALGNEQLLPDYGISINVEQYNSMLVDEYGDPIIPAAYLPQILPSSIEFSDSSKQWLTGISDQDGFSPMNWIRSGTADEDPSYADYTSKCSDPTIYNDEVNAYDESETFEKIIEGTWAPYRLVASGDCQHQPVTAGGDWATNTWESPQQQPDYNNGMSLAQTRIYSDMKYLSSVDIVFTADKSKWTRCPVLEMQDNPDLSWDSNSIVNDSLDEKYGPNTPPNPASTHKTRVYKQYPKWQPSLDKEGNPSTDPGYYVSPNSSTDPNSANYICGYGMGWFPGYAIDVTTGERLNMAFGEDSDLGLHGGNDMLFNPSAATFAQGRYIGGGKHFVYVFRNAAKDNSDQGRMVAYDAGSYFMEKFQKNVNRPDMLKIWRSCMWVGYPILDQDYHTEYSGGSPLSNSSFIATEARVKLRVGTPYDQMNTLDEDGDNVRDDAAAYSSNTTGAVNNWNPMYEFSTDELAVQTNVSSIEDSVCSLFNVVPNPYYAYSNYEFDKLENVVKIVNLPQQCSIRIYTVNGTLVRTFDKDDPNTYIDWDLKNYTNIPISSGVYLIHVKVPDGCEKVLKWFGVVRPPDLDQF